VDLRGIFWTTRKRPTGNENDGVPGRVTMDGFLNLTKALEEKGTQTQTLRKVKGEKMEASRTRNIKRSRGPPWLGRGQWEKKWAKLR